MFRLRRKWPARSAAPPIAGAVDDSSKPGTGATRSGSAGVAALDLSWITDTFAIGGSFAPNQTEALARDHGIAAVVDVRGEACDDEALLARYGIELLHLPTIDFEPISPRMLERGV